jgi:hypothetical protein
MRETWYVLESGAVADPNEVAPDETGALRHNSGVAVAMRGPVPSSRGVDADTERAKAAAEAAEKAEEAKANAGTEPAATEVNDDREMKASAGAKKYKTR